MWMNYFTSVYQERRFLSEVARGDEVTKPARDLESEMHEIGKV